MKPQGNVTRRMRSASTDGTRTSKSKRASRAARTYLEIVGKAHTADTLYTLKGYRNV
jgi:hypothetical protein